jgi:hypothetical protein
MTDEKFITKLSLKERGWTEKAIAQFAPDCDKAAPNPRFKKAAPMRLYSLSRIEEIEQSCEFKDFKQESVKRKAAAAKATETKKQKLLAELESWDIIVESKPLGEVRRYAIDAYNDHQEWLRGHREWEIRTASVNSDTEFLDRITVNYLRHQLSNYEDRLDLLFGKVGKEVAYQILRRKIMRAIADRYPQLEEECRRQANGG